MRLRRFCSPPSRPHRDDRRVASEADRETQRRPAKANGHRINWADSCALLRIGCFALAVLWCAAGSIAAKHAGASEGQFAARPEASFTPSRSPNRVTDTEPAAEAATDAATAAESVSEPAAEIVSRPAAFPSLAPTAPGNGSTANASRDAPQWASPAITVASSLAVVLGLFAGLVWLTRRFGSKTGSGGALPPAALQQLGSRVIDARTRIVMLRCGERILVVAQTAGGMQPLSEITEPNEVNQVIAACRGDAHHAFAQTIESLEKERVSPGFVGNDPSAPAPAPAPRRQLFATG